MRYLSLFSGIEAATVAWKPLGWSSVAFAEVAKFPTSLIAYRYPDVPNLGDVTTITQEQVKSLGPIDVVVGGFPCQDLSVAGKRAGLKDSNGNATRSGLFFDAIRIAEWARCRFTVIENVPGLFSSQRGRDFAAVVGTLAGVQLDVPASGWRNTGVCCGPRGLVEWCVLDAQWFGLAQRRKRVFLVRDSGDWANRPPILFDAASLRGDSPPSRETREDVAGTIASRVRGGGGLGTDFDLAGGLQVCGALRNGAHSGGGLTGRTHIAGELSLCLNAGGMGRIDYETETLIPVIGGGFDVAYQCQGTNIGEMGTLLTGNGNVTGGFPFMSVYCDVAHTLRGNGFDAGEYGTGRGVPMVPVYAIQERAVSDNMTSGPQGKGYQEGVAYTLEARHHVQAVAYRTAGDGAVYEEGDTTAPLTTNTDPSANTINTFAGVRRLTPMECERLQGFGDSYTMVPHRGKPAADGPRYQAIGNSMAVPVMQWIGRRIAAASTYID